MATPKETKPGSAPVAGGQAQPTSTAPAGAPATPGAPSATKAAAEERAKNDRFVRVMTTKDGKQVGVDANNGKKLAPQAQQIVNIIEAAGAKGLTRDEIIAKMKGVVKTRQPESRILSYYQKTIQENGMVTFTKAT